LEVETETLNSTLLCQTEVLCFAACDAKYQTDLISAECKRDESFLSGFDGLYCQCKFKRNENTRYYVNSPTFAAKNKFKDTDDSFKMIGQPPNPGGRGEMFSGGTSGILAVSKLKKFKGKQIVKYWNDLDGPPDQPKSKLELPKAAEDETRGLKSGMGIRSDSVKGASEKEGALENEPISIEAKEKNDNGPFDEEKFNEEETKPKDSEGDKESQWVNKNKNW